MVFTGPWQDAARGAGLLAADGTPAPTIFAEMSALASSTGALNLGQGFPDEDGPREVLDEARRAIAEGTNQYPPGRGTPDLLAAITEHQARFFGLSWDPASEVLVTAGATEALAAVVLAFVRPGDEVVTLEPTYDAYSALIALAGGTQRTVPLRLPGLTVDRADLEAAFSPRTRMVIVNSPHNPTGAILDRETLGTILHLAQRSNALLVTDEVYEHLVYDGTHVPIATLPGARERTLSISSAGKTFSTTGWKIGWMTGPAELVDAALAVKQFLTYVNGAPFQPAVALGLRLPDEVFTARAGALRHKRDLLLDGLDAAGFRTVRPAAGYFVVADAAPLGVEDGAAFCRALPRQAGVVGVPVSAFCRPGPGQDAVRSWVRFAFCKREDVLEDAVGRLAGLARG